MRKVSYYKCPECGMKYKSLGAWGNHMENIHPDSIPEGFSISRYFYFTLTGKTHGKCIQCGNCKSACIHDAVLEGFSIKKERCLGCGQCLKTCPTGAIEG